MAAPETALAQLVTMTLLAAVAETHHALAPAVRTFHGVEDWNAMEGRGDQIRGGSTYRRLAPAIFLLTILYIGKSVHERQPHQALRRRICHQHIQEGVQRDLLLEANTPALMLEKTNSCSRMEEISFILAAGSRSAQSAPCSQRRGPRIRLWAASEPPGETDRTWQTS